MKPLIVLGMLLMLGVLASACAEVPEGGPGQPPVTLPVTSSPTTTPFSAAPCEDYTSTSRSVFVSRPWQEGYDILFTYEDGFDDLSLEYLTVRVNTGTTWRTTEPWGVLGTGRGVKPSKGADFRVRGEGTAGQDRVAITAHFTDGSEDVIRIACE
jgi:hypothetical protein